MYKECIVLQSCIFTFCFCFCLACTHRLRPMLETAPPPPPAPTHRNGNQSSAATAPSKIKRKKNLNSIFVGDDVTICIYSPPAPLTLAKSFFNGSLILPAHRSKIKSMLQLRMILNKLLTKSNINSILLSYYYYN